MALGGGTNPGTQATAAKINTPVFFDKTSGAINAGDVHIGLTNLPGAAVQTVGSSPYTYTNSYMGSATTGVFGNASGLQQVFINGGTISAITVNRGSVNVSVPVAMPAVILSVNDSLTITYTVAPTVTMLQMF